MSQNQDSTYSGFKFDKIKATTTTTTPSAISSNISSPEINTDDEQDAALHLLDIKDSSRWTSLPVSVPSEKPNTSKVLPEGETKSDDAPPISIAKFYEPKFLKVFAKYAEVYNVSVNIEKHFLTNCMDHLVNFCCWTREDPKTTLWIRSVLDENPDLRPEVRNGLSMILIYCLSAAMVKFKPGSDMFTILQETEKGLGIVNKTSLKIYNDPFNYFNFLKYCIAGLIDSGKIPENERQNQPKRVKKIPENKEEIAAFFQLKERVVSFLEMGDTLVAQSKIQQICNFWQHGLKQNIRNRRFSMAITLLSVPVDILQQQLMMNALLPAATLEETPNLLKVGLMGTEHFDAGKISNRPSLGSDFDPLHMSGMKRTLLPEVLSSNGDTYSSSEASVKNPRLLANTTICEELSPTQTITPQPIPVKISPLKQKVLMVIRFERNDKNEWNMFEMPVSSLDSFTLDKNLTYYLINEQKLLPKEKQKKVFSSSIPIFGYNPLLSEFQHRDQLISTWNKNEVTHLNSCIQGYFTTKDPCVTSFFHYWNNSLKFPFPTSFGSLTGGGHSILQNSLMQSPDEQPIGVLVYEVNNQIGMVVRRNSDLDIKQDCWKLSYPKKFLQQIMEIMQNQTSSDSISFGNFLIENFPELRNSLIHQSVSQTNMNGQNHLLKDVVIKYRPHSINSHPITQPPEKQDMNLYQTIGTLNEDLSEVLSRFSSDIVFHDIFLQLTNKK